MPRPPAPPTASPRGTAPAPVPAGRMRRRIIPVLLLPVALAGCGGGGGPSNAGTAEIGGTAYDLGRADCAQAADAFLAVAWDDDRIQASVTRVGMFGSLTATQPGGDGGRPAFWAASDARVAVADGVVTASTDTATAPTGAQTTHVAITMTCPAGMDPGSGTVTVGSTEITFDTVRCDGAGPGIDVTAERRAGGRTTSLILTRIAEGDVYRDTLRIRGTGAISTNETHPGDPTPGGDGLFSIHGDTVTLRDGLTAAPAAGGGETPVAGTLTCGINTTS